jgi:hypothetical protein
MNFDHVLSNSAATSEFKDDLRRFRLDGHSARISTRRPAPAIKTMRVVVQLLAAHPELAVERVAVDARSGCSDFVGQVDVWSGGSLRRFAFVWDCAWRAEREGWRDCFGLPDQIRAAREFEWRCFERWEEADPDAFGDHALAVR